MSGKTVCGEAFVPISDHAASAVYMRNGRVCGVTVVMERPFPFLRCNIAAQLPPFARDACSWLKCMWELEDERAPLVLLDERDGEIVYCYSSYDLIDNIESVIDSILDFLLGDEFHEAMLGFVRSMMDGR